MISLRNIIIHDYYDVDLEKVWTVVAQGLPELILRLDALIPPLPGEQKGSA